MNRSVWKCPALALALILLLAQPASSFEFTQRPGSIFLFGGQFSKGTFPGLAMIPYADQMESNFLAGAAYDKPVMDLFWGWTLGVEVGLAGRFGSSSDSARVIYGGSQTSAELWGGVSYRHSGFTIGGLTIVPAIVLGLSTVTDSIGTEAEREFFHRGDASLLFYIGPELAFRFASLPNVDFVFRAHHRSGAEGTLGRLGEGGNANLFGVRFQY